MKSADPRGNPSERCAIAIMAKAPGAGRVKTRLSPFLSPEEAKDIGCCFLRDMTDNLALAARRVPLDPYIAFAPAGTEAVFTPLVAPGTRFVLADGSRSAPAGIEGFGVCLWQAIASLLEAGYAAAALLNSDSPTLPTACLVKAVRCLLEPQDRVVLGPSTDGGYYLIGARRPHAGLFRGIDWSTERVAAQTRAQAAALGLERVDLDTWYDVDDAGSLRRLMLDLSSDRVRMAAYAAPFTSAFVQAKSISERLAEGAF